MKWFTKKITVPESNETKEVDAIQLWEVRWYSVRPSIDDNYPQHLEGTEQLEAFPTEDEAQQFVTALKNAFALTRRTFATNVKAVRAR